MKRLMLIFVMILCLVLMSGLAKEETVLSLYPIRESGLWGYMNQAGEVVIEPQWIGAGLFRGKTAEVIQHSGNGSDVVRLIDKQGNEVLKTEWEYSHNGIFYDTETEKLGYYDLETGTILPPIYDDIIPPGYYDVKSWEDQDVLIVGRDEGEIIYPEWNNGRPHTYYGAVRIVDGEIIVPLQYDGLYSDVGQSEGYIMLANEIHNRGYAFFSPEFHLFDSEGNEVCFPDGIEPYGLPHEGVLTIVRRVTDSYELYGLGRPDGTVILEPCYEEILDASEGRVQFYQNDNIGYLDLNGQVVIPAIYCVSTGGMLGDINYQNGYAVIEDENTRQTVILDRMGNEIYSMPMDYDGVGCWLSYIMEGGYFWQGMKLGDKCEYQLMRIENSAVSTVTNIAIQGYGSLIWPPNVKWEDMEFSEGLEPICVKGECLYIDSEGKAVLPGPYDAATAFWNGLALVEKDGKLMYIDQSGAVVWEEK